MLEKDIENLIASYPDDFFPDSEFKLIGQQVKLGRCYADIIFLDKYNRKIIVEVKRGILLREHSGQVTEYYGLLKSDYPEDFVELILCANIIPSERKKFLEAIGIECKELGINMINQIAEKHHYKFLDAEKHIDDKQHDKKIFNQDDNYENSLTNSNKVWIFQANPRRYDILNALDDPMLNNQINWLVNQYKKIIRKGDLVLLWMSGNEAGVYAITEVLNNPCMLYDSEVEKKYWIDEKDKSEKDEPKFQVKLKIKKNLVNTPILKAELKQKNALENLSILKLPRGTNFPVTMVEWHEIRKFVQ